MAYHQVRDLRNRLTSGAAPARSPKVAAAGPSLAAVPAKRVDIANAKTAQAADLVDILQQKLASQHSELESRTDSINQIQRNFEKLHEKLLSETSSHANLQAQVRDLQSEKQELKDRNGQLVAEVAALKAQLAVAEGNYAASLRATALAEESADAAIRATSDELSRAEQAEQRCATLQAQLNDMSVRVESAERKAGIAVAAHQELLLGAKTFEATASVLQSQVSGVREGVDGLSSAVAPLGESLRKCNDSPRECLRGTVEAVELLRSDVDEASLSLQEVLKEVGILRNSWSASVISSAGVAVLQSKTAMWREVVCTLVRTSWSAKGVLLEQSRVVSLEGEVRALRLQAVAFAVGAEDVGRAERAHKAALAAREAEIVALRNAAIGSAASVSRYEADLVTLRREKEQLENRCSELLRAQSTRTDEVSMLEHMLEERQATTAEAQATLDALQQQLDASQIECNRLTELVQTLTEELEESHSRYRGAADESADLREKAGDAERRAEAAAEVGRNAARRVTTLEAELSSLSEKEVALTSALESLKSDHEERELALQRALADATSASLSATAAQEDYRSRLEALCGHRRSLVRLFTELDGVVSKLQHADGTIETAVTCLSCMRVLTCAKTLPCGHAACTACVAKAGSVCGDCGGAANPSVPAVGLDVVAANFNYRRQAMRGLLHLAERLKAQVEDVGEESVDGAIF